MFPGGLGAVRRRLRRVVPPGVRGCVLRDGRERRLHLHGLLPEGRRGERGRRGVDCGGGGRGERRRAGDVDVRWWRHAESAIIICCRLVVSSKPGIFTSAAAARASAGQLALKKNSLGLSLNTVPHTMSITQNLVSRLAFRPLNL